MRFFIKKKSKIKRFSMSLLLVLLVAISSIFFYVLVKKKIVYPLKYKQEICYYADKYNIDRYLLFSIVKTESSFDKNAESKRGAKGLMQLTPSTAEFVAKMIGKEQYNLFNINDNLELGCAYIDYLSDKFSDTFTLMASFNAGEGRVRAWLNEEIYSLDGKRLYNTPFSETNEYLKKIHKCLENYRKLYKNIVDKM